MKPIIASSRFLFGVISGCGAFSFPAGYDVWLLGACWHTRTKKRCRSEKRPAPTAYNHHLITDRAVIARLVLYVPIAAASDALRPRLAGAHITGVASCWADGAGYQTGTRAGINVIIRHRGADLPHYTLQSRQFNGCHEQIFLTHAKPHCTLIFSGCYLSSQQTPFAATHMHINSIALLRESQ